jgi:hypothetical protein
LVYNNVKVGDVILPNLTIRPGVNELKAKSYVHPDETQESKVAAVGLLTKFMNGVNPTVTVRSGTSALRPLAAALNSISIDNVLPANPQPLILDTTFKIPNLITFVSKTTIRAINVFDVDVSIVGIVSSVYYKGEKIGTIQQRLAPGDFRVPAKTFAQSPELDMQLDPTKILLLSGLLFAGRGDLDVESTLTMLVGQGAPAQFNYSQKNVPTVRVD